jgi:hypothetical protein
MPSALDEVASCGPHYPLRTSPATRARAKKVTDFSWAMLSGKKISTIMLATCGYDRRHPVSLSQQADFLDERCPAATTFAD